MLCLIDWARRRHGGDPLPSAPVLMESAALKASDIAACREFSHGACGKPPDDAFTSVAYGAGATASGVGENLAWGAGPAGSPLDVLNGWLNSPPHRSTLFRADWTEQGVALVVGPAPEGVGEAAIWVSHFGYRR